MEKALFFAMLVYGASGCTGNISASWSVGPAAAASSPAASAPAAGPVQLCVVPSLSFAAWHNGEALPWLATAAHFWTAVGVEVRVLEPAASAPAGCVLYDTDAIPFEAGPTSAESNAGVYYPSEHRAGANLDAIYQWLACGGAPVCGGDDSTIEGPTSVLVDFAHELGHSMGLQHVTDKDAVMNAQAHGRRDISDADAAEFFRVHQ